MDDTLSPLTKNNGAWGEIKRLTWSIMNWRDQDNDGFEGLGRISQPWDWKELGIPKKKIL